MLSGLRDSYITAYKYRISFRLGFDSNDSYDKRYEALGKAIADAAMPNYHWHETTSFHLIQSALDTDKLASKLKAPIISRIDHILIENVETGDAVHIGNIPEKTLLLKFLPKLKSI